MAKFEEIGLFDTDFKEWREHWKGMPEFIQEDKEPVQKITMNFHSFEDVEEFGKILGYNVTPKTNSLTFPKPDINKIKRRYIYES